MRCEETGEIIRIILQKIRGKGNFRGNEIYDLKHCKIVLEQENRKSVLRDGRMVIYLDGQPDKIYAEWRPDGRNFRLKDFEGMEAFVEALTDVVRGSDYLSTDPVEANYR